MIRSDPGSELSRFGLGSPRDRGLGRCVTSATPVSGRGITGGGSGYRDAAIWRTRDEFRTVSVHVPNMHVQKKMHVGMK